MKEAFYSNFIILKKLIVTTSVRQNSLRTEGIKELKE